MRDKINHHLRPEKQKYYNTYFERNNMKKIWSKINCIIHRKRIPLAIYINGNIISNPYEAGNKFNTFYTTVAQKLVNKLQSSKISFKQYLRNPIQNTFLCHLRILLKLKYSSTT